MSIEESTSERWLERREIIRDELYGEMATPSDGRRESLGDLALTLSLKGGDKAKNTKEFSDGVYRTVYEIMETHNRAALDGEESVYAVTDSDNVARLARLASRTIINWDLICDRYGTASPFADVISGEIDTGDCNELAFRRVIELGSAALEMFQYGIPFHKEDGADYTYLTSFVSRHGPEYVRSWMKKETIRDYCIVNGIDYENALSYFTPSQLKKIAIRSSKNPEEKAAQIIEWFNELTLHKIAAETGLSMEEADAAFSPSRIMFICWQMGNRAMVKIQDMAKKIDRDNMPVLSLKKTEQTEPVNYGRWLEHREAYRDEFYGETDGRMLPSLGAAALERSFKTGARFRRDLQVLEAVHHRVSVIMALHNEAAVRGAESLYALRDASDIQKIAQLVTKVIMYWREVCAADDRPFPFASMLDATFEPDDFGDPTIQRVIELGSVVIEMLQYGMPLSKHEKMFTGLAQHAARHSPEFTCAWMRGEAISGYCEANNIEYEKALPFITRAQLMLIALRTSKYPEKRAAQMIESFNMISPQIIATETGWSVDEVGVVFTPMRIMEICMRRRSDPLDKIKEIARRADTELTPQKIAEQLKWDVQRVETVFPRYVILRIVFAHSEPFDKIHAIAECLDNGLKIKEIAKRNDVEPQIVDKMFTERSLREIAMGAQPLKKVDQIVERYHGVFSLPDIALALGISEKRARVVFTDRARVKLADRNIQEGDVYARARMMLQTAGDLEIAGIPTRIASYLARAYTPDEAKAKADVVIREQVNKPSRTSDLMWMWAVAMAPQGTHQQRLDILQTRRNWFSITGNWTTADPQGDWRFDEYAKESSLIPAPMSTDPSPSLRELGNKAGVSEGDLKQLLLFFADMDSCELDDDTINELVARMKSVS